MKKIIYSIVTCIMFVTLGCTDEVEFNSNTEALGDFKVVLPETSATYTLNSGTPDKTITFTWTNAKPGVTKTPNYALALYKVDSESPFANFKSDDDGLSSSVSISFVELDNALEGAGFAKGEEANIQWQVIATNGDVEVTTGKTNITLKRFSDNGIANFKLLTPSNNKLITADIYGSPDSEVSFTWETATTTDNTGTISYEVLFDEQKGDFSKPLKSYPIASGEEFKITHQKIGEEFGTTPNLKWTVRATVAGTSISLDAPEKFINWDVFVINEFYLVGTHNGWDNATATPFVDKGNGAFELQIELPANAEFKFLPQLGSWDGDWGESKTTPGALEQDDEQNIKVTNQGKYVIKVDFPSLTFTVTEFKAPDNLFLVGSHNGWNNADATQQFFNDGDGTFVKVQTFSAGDEFKFLPTSGSWDGDWGESKTTPGDLVQDDEQNLKISDAGNYVVIVNFNTSRIKVAAINSLFAVGSHNGWNNADASQEFNTSGNGVFTKVLTFSAGDEFKLLPMSGSWDNDWGESKTKSGILEQDDEQNIKISTGGSFIITVDFNTLSYNLKELPENLYIVGSINGWDNSTAPAFTKLSDGVFEISQTLTASDEFKFLPAQGSWDNDWGESKSYSGMVVRDDEQNIKSPSAGNYTITVDFNKGTYEIK